MNRSSTLAKERRELIADYRTPLDAQVRQLNIEYSRLDARIFDYYRTGALAHQGLGTETAEFELIEFPEKVSRHDVEREFADSGLSKANITQQLAFSRLYKWKQFRLVALGTSVPRASGATMIPVLTHGAVGRKLMFENFPTHWETGTMFLAIVRPDDREYFASLKKGRMKAPS